MNSELGPRPASQAGTAPEAHNDTADLGLPRADIDNGNDQTGPITSQEPGTKGQGAQSSPNESCVPGRLGQEAEGDTEPRNHSDQGGVDGNVHLADLNDGILLSKIKDLLLSRLYRVSPDRAGLVANVNTFGDDSDDSDEIPEPFWWRDNDIGHAWPSSRNVAGVVQYIIEQDGSTPKPKVRRSSRWWSRQIQNTPYDVIESVWRDWCCTARHELQQEVPGTVDNWYSDLGHRSRHRFKGKIIYCASDTSRKGVQDFPISLLACALSFEEPFRFSSLEKDDLDVGKSTSFLSTSFQGGYSVRTNHDLHNAIHWQIRYFSPIHQIRNNAIRSLFSKRQTVTLQHGSGETILQEKRVVVSFRVLREAPELFSILVLKDEDISPDTHNPDQQFDSERFWKGYGATDPDYIFPFTYFLLEICRVFKTCMDAWEDTLRTIDKLVLVKLEDLDNLERVEELMFDNSFNRSRDYFVALQILRIIDGWLDEVQSTVEDMSKDHVLLKAALGGNDAISGESFEVAVRYVSEHATATKSRVRKKNEEINSLRDGLFNATSLRESTKAMALNQAIYVFTVVTVLFTPVSFLATFWALPFLNNPAEGSGTIPEPSAFRNSFIIMPILTYALVIGVAWFVGKRNSVRALLDLLGEYWEKSRSLMRSAWSSRPELPW
ncbi:uncharacterized protein FMAN_12992 [Fusarium mangiferae]|uniref:Uncharacterized protein n=1 Tax=Fusarium mangiferae TaxID=192010 RepID=A0A1L7UAL2_FUSMA|nr:uncharacterized protein FMAN_12992 [Fusarium mangiferae]CVL04995.1 uncharacterized protein FMAN_12992 [Fusarium mangiferae]